MRRLRWHCLVMVIGLAASGCSYLSDAALVASNRAAAELAWHTAGKPNAAGMPHALRHHFGLGFIQGYSDIGSGGNGAVPLFPPQCYWSPQYRTDVGREKVTAWFQGYQAGTLAAYSDGMAGSNKLPTSWAPQASGPQVHEPTAEPLTPASQAPIHPEAIPRPRKEPGAPEELPAVEILNSQLDEVSTLFRNWPAPQAATAETRPRTSADYFAAFQPRAEAEFNSLPTTREFDPFVQIATDDSSAPDSPGDSGVADSQVMQPRHAAGSMQVQHTESAESDGETVRSRWSMLIPAFWRDPE